MNVIAEQKFELTRYDVEVQRVSHYTYRTTSKEDSMFQIPKNVQWGNIHELVK